MSVPTAPPPVGRRPYLGSAVAMAAFLFLTPPLFLLTPLALLLLFSLPRTMREWFWIVIATLGSIILIANTAQSPSTEATVVTAGALFLSASYLLASHALKGWSPVARGLLSLAIAAAALVAWGGQAGISMAQIDAQVEAALRESVPRVLGTNAPAGQVTAALSAVPGFTRVVPGVIAFQALVGLGLAWRWYQRVAANPLPPAPRPFAEFRFGDQLVWGAIFTLALALLPLGGWVDRVTVNALVVWTGVYATRGLAVSAAATARWSIPGKLLMAGFSLLALPVAFGTLITLGLGDVWLDFRRRSAAPPFGGQSSNGSNSS